MWPWPEVITIKEMIPKTIRLGGVSLQTYIENIGIIGYQFPDEEPEKKVHGVFGTSDKHPITQKYLKGADKDFAEKPIDTKLFVVGIEDPKHFSKQSYEKMYAHALKKGLRNCPMEVALALAIHVGFNLNKPLHIAIDEQTVLTLFPNEHGKYILQNRRRLTISNECHEFIFAGT